MGREQAAIAVSIASTKPPGHFRGSAGAYFHGMVSKAKSGEQHLARTIWGCADMANIETREGSGHPLQSANAWNPQCQAAAWAHDYANPA